MGYGLNCGWKGGLDPLVVARPQNRFGGVLAPLLAVTRRSRPVKGAFPAPKPPSSLAPGEPPARDAKAFELRVVYDDPFVPEEEADPLRGRD